MRSGSCMNKWKRAFFALLTLIVLVCVGLSVLFYNLFVVHTSQQNNINETHHVGEPIFSVNANKQRLTDMINNEIQDHQNDQLTYQVQLTNDVTLTGDLKVLGMGIPFTMSFDPKVTGSGDIILKEKSVTLGRVNLPDEQVLQFIDNGTNFPDWVVIQASKKQIYVNLNEMPLNDQFYLKAKDIQLQKDKINFDVYQK